MEYDVSTIWSTYKQSEHNRTRFRWSSYFISFTQNINHVYLLTDFTSKLERRVSHLPPLVGSSDDDAAFLDWGGRGDHLSDPLILCEEDQSIHNLILIRFQLKFTFFVAIQRDKNNSSRSHSCSSVILLLFRLNQHSTFLSWTHIHCHISKKNMLLVVAAVGQNMLVIAAVGVG